MNINNLDFIKGDLKFEKITIDLNYNNNKFIA